MAEVRLGVDVVDRRRDVEARHISATPRSIQASKCSDGEACTSLIGRPRSAAALAQSSNSGAALSGLPFRARDLEPYRTRGRLDRDDLPVEALAQHLLMTDADGRRLGEQHAGKRVAAIHRSDHRDQRARPVLLHLHRGVVDVKRAGSVEPVHQRPEQLGIHVVDLAFHRDDPLERLDIFRVARAPRGARSDNRRNPCRRRRSRSRSTRIAGIGPKV